MAFIMGRERKLLHVRTIRSCTLFCNVVSEVRKVGSVSFHDRYIATEKSFGKFRVIDTCINYFRLLAYQSYSSTTQHAKLPWEASSRAVLLRKLESALNNHEIAEAWVIFNSFKGLYGFPPHELLNRLVMDLSYSADSRWLQVAYKLVILIREESPNLLQTDVLTKLSLSLARARMPIPASVILRVMLDRRIMPPVDVLQLVFLHMVKTDIGANLASNFLIQSCECFLELSAKKGPTKLLKPDTMTFNIILDGCVRFKSSLKGHQLLELMSQVGVIADAQSIILIAQIHEMNGLRDEIKKLKYHIHGVPACFLCHYQQLYNSLLNMHFKFDDIEAAVKLIMDLHTPRDSTPHEKCRRELEKPHLVSIGSGNIKSGLKIQIMPEILLKDSVLQSQPEQDLLNYRNGKIILRNKALAKLIGGCKRHDRISELSELLFSIEKEYHILGVSSLCSDVIEACVHVGWLETAHDILDDMEKLGATMSLNTYMTLLTAYYKKQMLKQGMALLRKMRSSGWLANVPNEAVVSSCLSEPSRTSDLAELLFQEAGEEKGASALHELNSTIYFFCKAKMTEDALKTYRKMEGNGIQPTVQTFAHLVHGYSSLGMYRDITIVWGDIKRKVEKGNITLCRDLYECLLLNFLRGGYFERVMEIVHHMRNQGMYADKWMYRCEFLKLHKNLYRNLKASKVMTNDVKKKRIEQVSAFRRWAGLL
ncbi:Pentatricopeptide repeat-containing protein At4g17616 [Linum grandiflorum]